MREFAMSNKEFAALGKYKLQEASDLSPFISVAEEDSILKDSKAFDKMFEDKYFSMAVAILLDPNERIGIGMMNKYGGRIVLKVFRQQKISSCEVAYTVFDNDQVLITIYESTEDIWELLLSDVLFRGQSIESGDLPETFSPEGYLHFLNAIDCYRYLYYSSLLVYDEMFPSLSLSRYIQRMVRGLEKGDFRWYLPVSVALNFLMPKQLPDMTGETIAVELLTSKLMVAIEDKEEVIYLLYTEKFKPFLREINGSCSNCITVSIDNPQGNSKNIFVMPTNRANHVFSILSDSEANKVHRSVMDFEDIYKLLSQNYEYTPR